ncbi:hypothetical protein DKX38_006727 [Salix brachista]|uniref:Uncharacterized protein n=1 Tax=Salix brachista TaxID=2182728 RepID=A0A5N5N2J9_9ROSI|nr:hypothetical protein DKX38_006727 [Salix brachista]
MGMGGSAYGVPNLKLNKAAMDGDFASSEVNTDGQEKALNLHDRRFIKDAAGNTLVNLGMKIMTMHGSWEAFRGESNEEKDLLFTIKKSKLIQFKTELDVFLANNKGEVPDFKVKGGYSECSYSVLLGDTNTVLAQMHGKHSPESIILEVYPNVDYAFIITLVIILDEINAKRRAGEDLLNFGGQIITS